MGGMFVIWNVEIYEAELLYSLNVQVALALRELRVYWLMLSVLFFSLRLVAARLKKTEENWKKVFRKLKRIKNQKYRKRKLITCVVN